MSFNDLTQYGPDEGYHPYYCIPSYQRQYTWEAPQVIQLLGDIYDYFLESFETKAEAFSEKFIMVFIVVEKESEVKQP